MILKFLAKNKTIMVAIISFIFGVLIYNYSSIIFQEGNPWPQIKGIAQLTFGNKDFVKLDIEKNKYITKSNNVDLIRSFMKEKGYDFIEQMGSGYFFQNDFGDRLIAVHKFYSRFYSIWTISETNNINSFKFEKRREIDGQLFTISGEFICLPLKNEDKAHNDLCVFGIKNNNYYYHLQNLNNDFNIFGTINIGTKIFVIGKLISENDEVYNNLGKIGVEKLYVLNNLDIRSELKDCLPKSDMASYEKCKELLDTIRSFNDCANAGFSITKSDPPQCETPDGKKFINEANSSWEVALIKLYNCEVKSLFQNHGKLVKLELKNGNEITAYEPQIDDVMKAAVELKNKCGDIRLATE
ncbi:MAG: hypothetical protein PHH83_02330 [Patescibacteria group bacterium]|nr:hypothetical protein [Patescibacteria group bacterium]